MSESGSQNVLLYQVFFFPFKLKMSDLIQVELSFFISNSAISVDWRELRDSTLTVNLIAVLERQLIKTPRSPAPSFGSQFTVLACAP